MPNLWKTLVDVAKSGGKPSRSSYSSSTPSVKPTAPSISGGPSGVSNFGMSSLIDNINYANVVQRKVGG